jgi:hypothetical protein
MEHAYNWRLIAKTAESPLEDERTSTVAEDASGSQLLEHRREEGPAPMVPVESSTLYTKYRNGKL